MASSYRPSSAANSRKRRRNQVPSYVNSDLSLALENVQEPPANIHIPDDDRVFRLLAKVAANPGITTNAVNLSSLVLVLTALEAAYLESAEIPSLLHSKLGLASCEIAPQTPGAIDTLAVLTGNANAVAQAAVYVSFCLCAKIKEVALWSTHTLKSDNFKLQMLAPTIDEKQLQELATTTGLSSLDVASTVSHYCVFSELQYVHIRSDIHSMVEFVCCLMALKQYANPLELKDIVSAPMFGAFNEPALFRRTQFQEKLAADAKASVVTYISTR